MSAPKLTDSNGGAKFRQKSAAAKKVINEALAFLHACGLPLEPLTARQLECMAMAVLATANVRDSSDWAALKTASDGRSIKTREIIAFENEHFGESISSGSYDDIRRKHLKLPVAGGIVVSTAGGAARNDPNRGYALSDQFGAVARLIGRSDWENPLKALVSESGSLRSALVAARALEQLAVTLPGGETLSLSPGEHNDLQRAVVEKFLPRYGHGAEVLYLGDTAKKLLKVDKERLRELKFFELEHGELPDVIAYSASRQWLYLIEAVHSSGPISAERRLKLKTLAASCTVPIIYVTAFLDRKTFRRFASVIAWETEVWIAQDPDHLIHFDGSKFLGPY